MRLTHPVLELWHGNCKIFPSINKIAKILPSQEQKILVRRRISNDRWKEIEYFPLKYSQKCKGLKGEKHADVQVSSFCNFLFGSCNISKLWAFFYPPGNVLPSYRSYTFPFPILAIFLAINMPEHHHYQVMQLHRELVLSSQPI